MRSHTIFTPERWQQLQFLYSNPRTPPLHSYIKKVYSQNGEEGILHQIFQRILPTNKYYVEFGAADGTWLSNTKFFREQGWSGLLLDSDIPSSRPEIHLYRVHLTPRNIEGVFSYYHVPSAFDLLSIDVDGNDFWLWKALLSYRPRVVIIEFHSALPNHTPLSVAYNDQNGDVPSSHYYGANLLALLQLAQHKKYKFVTLLGDNLFFVTEEEFPKLKLPSLSTEEVIRLYFCPNKELFHRTDKLNRLWVNPFSTLPPTRSHKEFPTEEDV